MCVGQLRAQVLKNHCQGTLTSALLLERRASMVILRRSIPPPAGGRSPSRSMPFGLGGEAGDQAMRQHRQRHVLDVLQPHHVAAQTAQPGLGAEDQVLHGARPGAPAHQRLEPLGRRVAVRARLAHQPRGVLIDVVRHRHAAHEVLVPDDLRRVQQVRQRRQLVAGRRAGDLDLLVFGRVVQLDQKHEAIELRLRQRIGAFLLDRVLRRQHEERRVERERLADRRDLLLLHRLEHRRLRLRRGAVDLVGQHDVGEHRPVHELELAPAVGAVLQDVGARDVHRHQVGRELDAAELQRHRLGQLAHQQRLGQPGHAHQQRVPAGEQADRQPLDHLVLADDHATQLLAQPAVELAQLVDRSHVVVVKLRRRRRKRALRHSCPLSSGATT